MTLAPGTKLGRYEIRSLIGAGGMGEVYSARDPKIGREVAVKVLPAAFSGDRERLDRFEQEAQAAGALNHPNILAIYDVDSVDGTTYVVSELLEGETLREAAGNAPMAVRRAVNYARQVAHGLAAAHEKGIIHRDLKPENIFVTKDGRAKILDFGLAKLTEASGDRLGTDLPTRKINTSAGAVMGTAGYMSPEQLRGGKVDPRTDIFSFGAVLYEMLSGRKAFHKDSTADTISAILREDPPDLSETNNLVSPAIERVVRRCLEKNREERFHSASDLAFALEALTSTNGSGSATAVSDLRETAAYASSSRIAWPAWVLAALLLISTITFAALYFRRADPQPAVVRYTLEVPDKMSFGDSLAISPDGRRIAVTINSESGEPSLWVRPVDALEAQKLPGTEGAAFPFWSPDGKYIAFFATSKLKRIDANGGPVQSIADASVDPRGGFWHPDGNIVYAPDTSSGLSRVSANGGPSAKVTELDPQRSETSHRWPALLPDGKHFLYFARGTNREVEGVFVGTLDSAERKFLFGSRTQAIYARPQGSEPYGHILFVRDQMLLSQPFDADRLEFMGDAVTIAQSVRSFPSEVGPTAASVVSVSDNGHLAYRTGAPAVTQLQWVDRSGKDLGVVGTPAVYHEPMILPDGKRIVFARLDDSNQDVWVLETARNVMSRFTFDPAPDGSQVFSRDGSRVYFASNRNGKFAMYQKPATGLGAEDLLLEAEGNLFPDGESPDGKFLMYEADNGMKTKFDILALPLTGDKKPFPLVQTEFTETHGSFSPDGRWFMYSSDESGRPEVYVQSFPAAGGKWQVSVAGGDQALWSPNGKEIVYLGFDRVLYSVPYSAGTAFEAGKPAPLFQTRIPQTGITDERNSYLIHPDGQRFMLNNLLDEGRSAPVIVVLNWSAEIKK